MPGGVAAVARHAHHEAPARVLEAPGHQTRQQHADGKSALTESAVCTGWPVSCSRRSVAAMGSAAPAAGSAVCPGRTPGPHPAASRRCRWRCHSRAAASTAARAACGQQRAADARRQHAKPRQARDVGPAKRRHRAEDQHASRPRLMRPLFSVRHSPRLTKRRACPPATRRRRRRASGPTLSIERLIGAPFGLRPVPPGGSACPRSCGAHTASLRSGVSGITARAGHLMTSQAEEPPAQRPGGQDEDEGKALQHQHRGIR